MLFRFDNHNAENECYLGLGECVVINGGAAGLGRGLIPSAHDYAYVC